MAKVKCTFFYLFFFSQPLLPRRTLDRKAVLEFDWVDFDWVDFNWVDFNWVDFDWVDFDCGRILNVK